MRQAMDRELDICDAGNTLDVIPCRAFVEDDTFTVLRIDINQDDRDIAERLQEVTGLRVDGPIEGPHIRIYLSDT